jgi:hypothetical protein
MEDNQLNITSIEQIPIKPAKGTQTNNTYKITDKSAREKWWNDEGINKYSQYTSDNSINKRGEFNDVKLERTYRNAMFKKTFGHLPNYSDLASMSDNEADSYLARWYGRTQTEEFKKSLEEFKEKKKVEGSNKKEIPQYNTKAANILAIIGGAIKQGKTKKLKEKLDYSYENNPEGLQDAQINGQLNYIFGEGFSDNWTPQERKKFYDDWDVKNTGAGTFMQAAKEYPELLGRTSFTSDEEIKDYFLNSFERVFEAGKGKYAAQQLNVSNSDTPTNLNANTGSIMNPAGMQSFDTIVNLDTIDFTPKHQEIPESTAYNPIFIRNMELTTKEDWDRFAEDIDRKSKEYADKEKRLKKYEEEWYKTNPVNIYTGTGTYNNPLINRKKAAREYAKEQDKIAHMTPQEKREYDNANARKAIYAQSYKDMFKGGLEPFWRINAEGKLRFSLQSINDNAAQYAEEANSIFERQNYTIPKEDNPFANGISSNDMKKIVQTYSGLYDEFKGSAWMPVNDIPYNKIYERTKDLWESGHIAEAIYQMDKIIEDDVIDVHQKAFGTDGLGHYGSVQAAANQFMAMGVESLTEGVTFLPSLAVGIGEAFFPTHLQSESGMGFLDRALDNTLHNDWIPIANNQNVSDWAAEINNNNIIYGHDFDSYLLKASGTAGAQVGNLLMFWAGGLEAGAARKLLRKSATATKRVQLQKFVNEGNIAKRELQLNKSIENLNLFKANYGEAAQQALEGERQIYEQGESKKWELVDKYTPENMPQMVYNQETQTGQYDYEFSFTEDEFNQSLEHDPMTPAWRDYQNGITNIAPEDINEYKNRIYLRAEGLHKFNIEHPNYDDNVALNAKLKANIDLATQTTLLFGFDKLFGGLDKWTLDYAMGRKSLSFTDLKNRINGVKIGNLKLNKQVGKKLWSVTQNPIMETITEVGQQSGSAITKQIAEHNVDSFLENQLYGNGLMSWAATTYEGLWNLNGEEFSRDAAIKETILQTLLTTPLMPVLGGWRGGLSKRGTNQSWISRALEVGHYLAPIKTTLGHQLYNIGVHNKEAQAAVDYINRWGLDANNQSNTRGFIGVQNYSDKMIADLIDGDEVAYNNDVFSRTLSEAIMLANNSTSSFAQNRLQWLSNMASIKSASREQQQQAIDAVLSEAAGNSAVRNLTDREILDLVERSANIVLDMYNKVSQEIQSINSKYGEGTLNWQQVSAKLFNKFAQENLNERIIEKNNLINDISSKIANIDLGKSTSDFDKVNSGKVAHKDWHLSGQDLLKLDPIKRAFAFSPSRRGQFNSEQQQIIEQTVNAINSINEDGTKVIDQIAQEIRNKEIIQNEYKKSLETPDWQSKRVKDKTSKVKKGFGREANIRRFNERVSKARTVSELWRILAEEDAVNNTRRERAQFDIGKILENNPDPRVKQKIEEIHRIEKTANAIVNGIEQSSLPNDTKESLINQLEELSSNINSADELLDISRYNYHVSPDMVDDVAGILTDILREASDSSFINNTVDENPITEQSGEPVPNTTDLDDKDIDTAAPVNDKALVPYTVDEFNEKLKELNDLENSVVVEFDLNGFPVLDSEAWNNAVELRQELWKRVPFGYEFRPAFEVGALSVLVKKEESSNQSQNQTLTEPEKEIEQLSEESVEGLTIEYEDIVPVDKSLDVYPDNDVRSVTKIAVGKYSEDGKPYTFAIRDEEVQDGDRAETSYTDRNGQVHTGTTGPLEIISIEEFNKRREANPKDYTKSLEELANYDRPKFVSNTTNQEVLKVESNKPIVKTNRTEAQQQRLNENITPARNEISAEFMPQGKDYKAKEEGKEFTRLGNTDRANIDNQLEAEGAFEYRDSGALQVGDKIEFVVSQEQMPDGPTQVVIWEVTEPKDKQIDKNSKFKGKQVLSVLDQTNAQGKRKELIDRIRAAYNEAGKPDSLLYDKEAYAVTSITEGIIPFNDKEVQHNSDSNIETNNLNKGFTKKNGKWGIKFFSRKTGKNVHMPVVLIQSRTQSNGTVKTIKTRPIENIDVLKTKYGTGQATEEVMLVVPTVSGYKSMFSVYSLKRNLPNAVDKYRESIKNGSIGKALVEKIKNHISDIKNLTAFSDYLGFTRGTSEYVLYDRNHSRLDLGYRNNKGNTTLTSAIKRGDKWFIVEPNNALNVIDDNNGKGYSIDELCKIYLEQLVTNEDVNATVRINMEAIKDNNSILDNLIDDGMLWCPNAINARFGMENVGFSASLGESTTPTKTTETTQIKEEPKETPKAAPVVSSNNPTSTTTNQPKVEPKLDEDETDLTDKFPRRKRRAKDRTPVEVKPTTPIQEKVEPDNVTSMISEEFFVKSNMQEYVNNLIADGIDKNEIIVQHIPETENSDEYWVVSHNRVDNTIKSVARLPYGQLNSEYKQKLDEKGFNEEEYNKLTDEERENVLNC